MNLASAPQSIVSKSQYAVLKNVTPGRVTQWISERKIDHTALVGEGRSAKINVRAADECLRRNLDISQRLGNGIGTKLSAPPTAAAQPALPIAEAPAPAPLPITSPADPIEEQIKREKLEGLQRENRKRAEEEAARAGRYVETASAQQEMAKLASDVVTIFEGGLPQIAAAFASQFSIPQRDALHLLRNEVRALRTSAASTLKQEALTVPEAVEVEIEAPAPSEEVLAD